MMKHSTVYNELVVMGMDYMKHNSMVYEMF